MTFIRLLSLSIFFVYYSCNSEEECIYELYVVDIEPEYSLKGSELQVGESFTIMFDIANIQYSNFDSIKLDVSGVETATAFAFKEYFPEDDINVIEQREGAKSKFDIVVLDGMEIPFNNESDSLLIHDSVLIKSEILTEKQIITLEITPKDKGIFYILTHVSIPNVTSDFIPLDFDECIDRVTYFSSNQNVNNVELLANLNSQEIEKFEKIYGGFAFNVK